MRPPLTKRCPPLPILSTGLVFGTGEFVLKLDVEEFLFTSC